MSVKACRLQDESDALAAVPPRERGGHDARPPVGEDRPISAVAVVVIVVVRIAVRQSTHRLADEAKIARSGPLE